jgi:hypothetical protein
MLRRNTRAGQAILILLLSCVLALGLAFVQGGLALSAQTGAAHDRGVLLAVLGGILVYADLAGIARFIYGPSQDE